MIHPYTYVGLNMPKEKRTVLCDTIINICKIVSEVIDVPAEKILDRNRTMHFVQARQIVYKILRKHYKISYPSIGKLVKRDHSTIIHSIEMHECDYNTNSIYKKCFDYVEKKHLEC